MTLTQSLLALGRRQGWTTSLTQRGMYIHTHTNKNNSSITYFICMFIGFFSGCLRKNESQFFILETWCICGGSDRYEFDFSYDQPNLNEYSPYSPNFMKRNKLYSTGVHFILKYISKSGNVSIHKKLWTCQVQIIIKNYNFTWLRKNHSPDLKS